MLVLSIMLVLFIAVVIVVISERGSRIYTTICALLLILYSLGVGATLENNSITESEKGYNVFPVYEVSGNDTINTTWYVRKKK